MVHGTAKDFEQRDPRGDEALLVVEVSRTTQQLDRDKAAIYAEGGVSVYWLVDVAARRVETHVDPAGGRYRLVQVVGEHEELDLPGQGIGWRVADLLPTS